MEGIAGGFAAAGAEVSGFPREVLQKGYQYGFINGEWAWLLMLKKHNTLVHIYDESEADEVVGLVENSFLPTMSKLARFYMKKQGQAIIWRLYPQGTGGRK